MIVKTCSRQVWSQSTPSSSVLRLEPLVSCFLNKGRVCSFSSGGVQRNSSNLAIPAWDLTKTGGSQQVLHVCDGGQPFPWVSPCQNTGRAGVEEARRKGFS